MRIAGESACFWQILSFLSAIFRTKIFNKILIKNYDSHTQGQKDVLPHFSAKIFHLYDLAY